LFADFAFGWGLALEDSKMNSSAVMLNSSISSSSSNLETRDFLTRTRDAGVPGSRIFFILPALADDSGASGANIWAAVATGLAIGFFSGTACLGATGITKGFFATTVGFARDLIPLTAGLGVTALVEAVLFVTSLITVGSAPVPFSFKTGLTTLGSAGVIVGPGIVPAVVLGFRTAATPSSSSENSYDASTAFRKKEFKVFSLVIGSWGAGAAAELDGVLFTEL
jgi:hypothetical protein